MGTKALFDQFSDALKKPAELAGYFNNIVRGRREAGNAFQRTEDIGPGLGKSGTRT